MKEPHFDPYADRYRELHAESVRVSGDEPAYFAAYKARYMAGSLGTEAALRPLDLLDFGCGIGGSIPHLATCFPEARLYGVDVSGESLDRARQAHPGAVFSLIEGNRLPLDDASVDVAMAACVYHHIAPEQRVGWTRELKRVLRPGGHAFIFEHNPLNPVTQKVVRDCPFDDDAILLPRTESQSLLQLAGFRDVDVEYIVFFPRALAWLRPLERAMGWLPLGAQYVVRGRA